MGWIIVFVELMQNYSPTIRVPLSFLFIFFFFLCLQSTFSSSQRSVAYLVSSTIIFSIAISYF